MKNPYFSLGSHVLKISDLQRKQMWLIFPLVKDNCKQETKEGGRVKRLLSLEALLCVSGDGNSRHEALAASGWPSTFRALVWKTVEKRGGLSALLKALEQVVCSTAPSFLSFSEWPRLSPEGPFGAGWEGSTSHLLWVAFLYNFRGTQCRSNVRF